MSDKVVSDLLAGKELNEDIQAIAEAITDYMISKGKAETRDFLLFVVDRESGRMQFISDMPREDSISVVQVWLKRELQ